jgi:hypothetical protein
LTPIALSRQFIEWHEGEYSDPDFALRFIRSGLMSWETASARHRVVVLAEAGSGKTTEMREQTRIRREAGQFAVYATVEDVGREGLDSALGTRDQARLASWRGSDGSGWFFVDSVDEAKLSGIRLEKAIRRIADGIVGCERRSHVILSGRLTDWEFRRDLRQLTDGLPVPKDPSLPAPPTADQILTSTLRNARQKAPAATADQEPLVVRMAPLDPGRIRLFATAKGARNLDAFLEQIEAAKLWRFAQRPLDLDWLVDFWESHGRLGSLAEMLENSLRKRIGETNLDRARGDALDETRALHAIDRIGAALVFGRKTTIAIPDSELVLSNDEGTLDVAHVLPDWSPGDRARLLTRPVFDPATFGRARLHNDNEGVVRAYLTARWLSRLRQENLSRGKLFALLFETTYGLELIKPSMQETAAWLALWDEDVAREVAHREPSLLLTAGDPASLSKSVREAVLADVVERLTAEDQELPPLDGDSVRRFARPDLSDIVRALWSKHHGNAEVRGLLLELIWLGELGECADLAAGSVFGIYTDRNTRLFGGRALAAAGDEPARRRYSEFIEANCKTTPPAVVWDAVDALFPRFLNVDGLLGILAVVDITDADGGSSFQWQSAGWVDRLNARSDLERLLRGLLDQLGDDPGEIGRISDKREEAYFAAVAAAACRLLDRCRPDEAPEDAIDAALELGVRFRYSNHADKVRDIAAELHRYSPRRRLAFWRAAERLSRCHMPPGRRLEDLRNIEFAGYSPGLQREDIEWLAADAPGRVADNERVLAINTAMLLWRQADSPTDLLPQIEKAARSDAAMQAAYDNWWHPPPPTEESVEQERRMNEISERAKAEQAARDRSWVEFIAGLRKEPDQLRHIRPPTPERVDSRLYHLWQLSQSVDSSSRYGIASVAPLEPMLGVELAAAFRDALIGLWRLWRPRLKSLKADASHNQTNILDCMGIAGVSLEAAMQPHWAEQLTSDEAVLAASYATLEMNGFPSWLSALAIARPAEVRSVLVGEIEAELAEPQPRDWYKVLESVSRADKPIPELMAPALFEELRHRDDCAPGALSLMLSVVAQGLTQDHQLLAGFAIGRFNSASDARVRGLYLGAAFNFDAVAATDALMTALDSLEADAQTALVEQILPGLFGTWFRSAKNPRQDLDFGSLERLLGIALRTIGFDSRNRQSGEVFTPDEHDNARQALNTAFALLRETPGRATFDALLRLADNPNCPIPKARLDEFARERAAKDSESEIWAPAETVAFEAAAETAPSTPKDLQRLALRRFDDIQYDLLHADFAQGSTVKTLPDENAVQNWVADRLDLKRGRAYSVERESHVVDEKEPDVRLRAKATDAKVAIEIKIPESWTLKELEAALRDQLCGQYLQARDARQGVLLLVHQRLRGKKGWQDTETGAFLTFSEVVDRLRALTTRIAGAAPDAPQPEIAVLDVSSLDG